MQNPHIPGGYWSQQFPCYNVRMEQMSKMFRFMNIVPGTVDTFVAHLSLVPKV